MSIRLKDSMVGNITGNAATATKLATARKINGVAFDGTADITVSASASWSTLSGKPSIDEGGTIYSIQEGCDTVATGIAAHAQGVGTISEGIGSHSEGSDTKAIGDFSHAEGCYSIASGAASHAEGCRLTDGKQIAYGKGSHVEGIDCVAGTPETDSSNMASHAEGYLTIASSQYSHSEGYKSESYGYASHSEGYNTKTYGYGSHAEGYGSRAGLTTTSASTTFAAHAEGYNTQANGKYSHAEGDSSQATGTATHAEGYLTKATGNYSHTEGYRSSAAGTYSHAEGYNTATSGSCSHAGGSSSKTTGDSSFAHGYACTGSGSYSVAFGYGTYAQGYAQTVIGQYNNQSGTGSSLVNTDSGFIIGAGYTVNSSVDRRNAFRVTWSGEVYSRGAYSTSGADYAEMFEWYDGNPDNEERLGYFVTVEKGTQKIRKANSKDKYILGVISNATAILGDNYDEEWKDKYARDKWGRIQYQTVESLDEVDNGNGIVKETVTKEVPIMNPVYCNSEKYVPRQERKEWDAVGLLGKLLVYHDGTCEVGDFCMPNDDGIATKSETGYLIIDKFEDLVKVIIK